ncbi:hypothetical protein [Bacillus sp. FJAT-27245]|uniref:hypothetical protein n=1 Tax=Bacillus sp. FJAT-27245 TaxID=1684144 RepID=UPI0006A77308|nr:hypothetical protein [Bacillus sp. FJAT-27245]
MGNKQINKSLEENRAKGMEDAFKTVFKAGGTEVNESYRGAAGRALAKGNNEPMRIYIANKKALEDL